MDVLAYLFDYFFPKFPFAPLWLLGIVLAFRYRRRHRRVSLVAGLALALFLAVSFLIAGLLFWTKQQEQAGQDFQAVFDTISAVVPIVTMSAWLLVLGALFGWRAAPPVIEQAHPRPLPDFRTVIVATLLGALAGSALLAVLRVEAPFYLAFFGTTAGMVLFGIGWGAFVGGATAATDGPSRAAIIGAAAGLVSVAVWAAAAGTAEAGRILAFAPYSVLIGGLLCGGLRWVRPTRSS